MKAVLLVALTALAAAGVPARSIDGYTHVMDLVAGETSLLITEDLSVTQGSLENVMARETASGFGRWCYVGQRSLAASTIHAGTVFPLQKISYDNGLGTMLITTSPAPDSRSGLQQEKLEIRCSGGQLLSGFQVKRLENIFLQNLKFIKR